MKNYLFLFIFLLSGLFSYSQDLNNIKKMVLLQQYEKAKPLLDTYLNDEKNAAKSDGWYYKAFVDNSLGRVKTKTMAESKILFNSAYDAVKKYAQLDPKAPLTAEEKNSTVYNIYYSNYDLGIKTFNEKNFTESYEFFKKTLDVHDYIYNNKLIGPNDLKFSMHDTDIVWNLAVLANELKINDEALLYNKKIADADLSEEKYAGAYDDLVKHYKKTNNKELFSKYIMTAKKYFPIDNPYWESLEIDFAINGLEGEALLNKYEELTVSHPGNYFVFYNYGIELDDFIVSPAAKGKDIAGLKKKMEESFIKALSINSTIEANLQMANLYYSRMYETREQAARIKGTKPEEVKLKKELLAKSKELISMCVPYTEEAVKLLSALKKYKYSDKANFKLAYEILSNAAKQNGNTDKVAEYEKKKAEVDNL